MPEILQALKDAGYTDPTPIQAQAIPVALGRADITGIAQTGTGKTASFTLPIIQHLSSGRARARMPRSLILEPTRELAMQVADNFDLYGKYTKLSKALLIGGVTFDAQDRLLDRGVDVLIATPGRLLDHVERGKVLLRGVEILVIDEADRMLDMGFIPDIERIVRYLSATRQTLLFSATMPPEIQKISREFLRNPTRIEVAPPASVVDTVSQHRINTDSRQKLTAMARLLKNEQVDTAIIFCNRKRDIAGVQTGLRRLGLSSVSLHGDMDQYQRIETLERFRARKARYLIASDVAARGLDIPTVSHVINYDVPTHAEDYVHRIGRTGRAGRAGRAFILVAPDDDKYIDAIEALIGQTISVHDSSSHPLPKAQTQTAKNPSTQRAHKHRTRRGNKITKERGKPAAGSSASQGKRRGWTAEDQTARDQTTKDQAARDQTTKTQATKPSTTGSNARTPSTDGKGFGKNVPEFLRN